MRILRATGKALLVAVAAMSLWGCKHDPDQSAQLADAALTPPPPDFGGKARDVFEVNCAACHKKDGATPQQFKILDFAAIKDRKSPASGVALVDVSTPPSSLILQRMNDQAKPMPPSGMLVDGDRQAVADWIAAGAPEAAPSPAAQAAEAAQLANAVSVVHGSYEQPLAIGTLVPFAKSWSPKRLLEYSCAPCHSSSVKPPWYAKFDVTGTIKADMEKAVAVWEMGSGFPFNGSTTRNQMIGDLKLLHGALAANKMPPAIFVAAHPQAYLDTKYRSALMFWCDDAVNQLRQGQP